MAIFFIKIIKFCIIIKSLLHESFHLVSLKYHNRLQVIELITQMRPLLSQINIKQSHHETTYKTN